MPALNSKSFEKKPLQIGSREKAKGLVQIQLTEQVAGEPAGTKTWVDPSLAHHYCRVREAAKYIREPKPDPPKAPPETDDRAMRGSQASNR